MLYNCNISCRHCNNNTRFYTESKFSLQGKDPSFHSYRCRLTILCLLQISSNNPFILTYVIVQSSHPIQMSSHNPFHPYRCRLIILSPLHNYVILQSFHPYRCRLTILLPYRCRLTILSPLQMSSYIFFFTLTDVVLQSFTLIDIILQSLQSFHSYICRLAILSLLQMSSYNPVTLTDVI